VSEQGTPVVSDQVLNALVSNTEAMTHLNVTLNAMQKDFAEARQASREVSNTMIARVENMDRSIAEMRLAQEQAETNRSEEMGRIYKLLIEERNDRRKLVEDAREDEKDARLHERDANKKGMEVKERETEWIKAIIKEEMGDRKEQRDLKQSVLMEAGKEVWRVGGQWIVAAVAFGIVYLIMHLTGANLADVLGFAKP
jgi:hypothetical protein